MELIKIDDDHYHATGWPEAPNTPVDISRLDPQRWQIWLGRRGPRIDRVTVQHYLTPQAAFEVLRRYHRAHLRRHLINGAEELESFIEWVNGRWESRVEDPRDTTRATHEAREDAFASADNRVMALYPGHDCARSRCEDWQTFGGA